jgi:hypothetical protein
VEVPASADTPGTITITVSSSTFSFVVGLAVAVAGISGLSTAVPLRAPRILLTTFLVLVLLAVGSVLFLLFWGEEAAGDFLEKPVGNLFGAVINRFESQGRHLLWGARAETRWRGEAGDVMQAEQ